MLAYTVSQGVSSSSDFDGMCEQADRVAARAVDAILEGLAPSEQAAVRHLHLGVAWRFPRNNMLDLYEKAKMKVGIQLRARGIE